MYNYNDGRNFAAVMCNPNGKGYIVTATNVAKGETIEVSNVIQTIEEAHNRAQRFAGYSVTKPMDYDALDQHLSERLGF
jgi:hypothetical protein